ncbi:dTDP-4-dehydrorhamnose reductase [Sorangium sp. So ce118]
MKILLLGASGQVGFDLQRTLAPLGELVCATRSGSRSGRGCVRADLAEPAALPVLLDSLRPNLIVNAAAYTAVDRAEDEPDLAMRVNTESVAAIARWAHKNNGCLVHYSTDYVFDGAGSRPYGEDDPTAPLGSYGRSKLAGEQAITASGCDHLILRTSWVFAARGQNFLLTMLRLARERDSLRIVADQRGAPTTSRLLASATAIVASRWLAQDAERRHASSGIYHMSAAGVCSWFDFASEIFTSAARTGLLARVPKLESIATAQYPTKAKRPAWSVLETTRIQRAFGISLPGWQQGLEDVIDELADRTAG